MAHTRCQLLERVTQLRRIRSAMEVLLVQGVDELDLFVDFGRLRRMHKAADRRGPDRFHDERVHSLQGEQHSVFEPDEGRCGSA